MPLTFVGMLREAVQELTDLDGRFIKTVTTLLIRPGRITKDYLRYRRASYLPPLRIYLIASVILYFVLGSLTAQLTFPVDLIDNANIDVLQNDEVADRGLFGMLDARLDDISNSLGFGARVFAHLPEVGLVLLPVVGLILKALFFDQHRPYGARLLAAVHIKTGVFFLVVIAALSSRAAAVLGKTVSASAEFGDVAIAGVILISSVYVGVSLFVIYDGNIFLSIIRTAALLLSYWVLSSIGLLGVAVILALNAT